MIDKIFNDFLVIDNFFENPNEVKQYVDQLHFYSSEIVYLEGSFKKGGRIHNNWLGYRSEDLSSKLKNYLVDLFSKKIFANYKANVYLEMNLCFHLLPSSIKKNFSWWHSDKSILAGVVYLNEHPEKNSGTIMKINEKDFIVDNVFNRMLIYNASIPHRPENGFGYNFKNSRITLTFFIQKLHFNYE